MLTPENLVQCGLSRDAAATWSEPLQAAADRFGINTGVRLAHWLGQLFEECAMFTVFQENLNYRPEALVRMWPSRFPPALAREVGFIPGVQKANQQRIANIAYANRYGNGPESSGDGWRYRGVGPKQITFKDNYHACGLAIGVDLVANPDQLLVPEDGALSAGWYWASRDCNRKADAHDVVALTQAINGGQNGLVHRQAFTDKCMAVLA